MNITDIVRCRKINKGTPEAVFNLKIISRSDFLADIKFIYAQRVGCLNSAKYK